MLPLLPRHVFGRITSSTNVKKPVRLRAAWPALASTVVVAALSCSVASPSAAVSTSESKRQPPAVALSRGEAFMGWNSRSAATREAASSPDVTTSAVSAPPGGGIGGIDVSGWQRTVNWSYWTGRGKTFAYVKATEGSSYRNKYFPSQFHGSYSAGMFRGSYHFAIPNASSGSTQASYFVAHGGSWSRDGRTLPGVLDIEYNPYGQTCYGLSSKQMVAWIKAFNRRYKELTSRDAVIYTTLGWWSRCTGNSSAFSTSNPLWVARYSRTVGTLPGKWPFYTFWQYSASPLDQDRFSSRRTRLEALANG